MSKFCEKCGNQLNDNDVFCEKCGTRVELGEMTNSTDTAQSLSGSVSQQATVQPEIVILQKKKMNPLKIIIPIVSGVLVVTLVIALVMMLGKGVVKTSKDGKNVFAFNPKEFVERYNETNADVLTSEFDFSSFEHSTNDDGNDLYKKTYSDAAYVLFTDGAGYASNVETIKYWYDSEESYTPPGGIVRELRAVYPDLSYDEAESILIDAKAKNSYVGYEYRDVKITYEYDKSYSAQSWFISPK